MGGGIARAALVYFVTFILYGVVTIFELMVYISGNYFANKHIRGHYERHYGAKIEHIPY